MTHYYVNIPQKKKKKSLGDSKLPDVHFGVPSENTDESLPATDDNDDDEQIKTPSDVVEILGFDPAK